MRRLSACPGVLWLMEIVSADVCFQRLAVLLQRRIDRVWIFVNLSKPAYTGLKTVPCVQKKCPGSRQGGGYIIDARRVAPFAADGDARQKIKYLTVPELAQPLPVQTGCRRRNISIPRGNMFDSMQRL